MRYRSKPLALATAAVTAAVLSLAPASAGGDPTPGPIFEDLGTGVAYVAEKTSFLKGEYTINVQKVTIPVGGVVPWHCHPGPVLFLINEGELTHYEADGTSHKLYAGDADVERIGELRTSQSTGDVPFEGVIIFAAPQGEPGTHYLSGSDAPCPKG